MASSGFTVVVFENFQYPDMGIFGYYYGPAKKQVNHELLRDPAYGKSAFGEELVFSWISLRVLTDFASGTKSRAINSSYICLYFE